MTLDLLILGLIALFAFAGYHSGAVRQLSLWIGLAAAYLLAKPTSALLSPAVAARMEWPVSQTASGLNVVLLPVILLAVTLAARLLLNALEPGEEQGPLDQGLGVPVGAVKGAAILFVTLCLAATLEKPLARIHFDLAARTQGSWSMAFARKHNPFADEHPYALDALKKLADARSDPKAKKELLKNKAFKSLLSDSNLKAALDDSSVKKALRAGDFAALLKNPLIDGLLKNPDLAGKLNKF
ncbi:MAG: CvpA family protein [Elusimicrobiota bacterium]|jgi:membrane protein required for colicin V production